MFGLATTSGVEGMLGRVRAHLERVESALERSQQRIAAQDEEIQELRAALGVVAEGAARPVVVEAPKRDGLPPEVRRAIALRCGRGNVNRKALLETSARVMLDDPDADPTDVASQLLNGSGDFEV